MSNIDMLSIARKMLKDELEAALIYGVLARRYRGSPISDKLIEIARIEAGHARFWRKFLEKRGVKPDVVKPSRLKIALYRIILRVLGLGLTLKLLELGELNAIKMYALMLEHGDLSEEERADLRKILEDELIHEEEFVEEESRLAEFLDHVRDAVLGMSDGVVEVLSVSAGLAGAYGDPFNVALGGLIVGIGGALSMGIGAYTSVRAQREVRLGVLTRLVLAARFIPQVFQSRIMDIMKKKGLPNDVSEKIADTAIKNPDLLQRILAEEKYGIREEKLEEPGRAGFYTGLFYILGAAIPLTPYFLRLDIGIAVPLSFLMAALTMSLVGFIIALTANLDIRKKMIELVAASMGAALITYSVGRLASILFGIEVE